MSDDRGLGKALALVQRLHARTSEGKVDWEPAAAENRFEVRLGRFVLALTEIFDPEYPDQPDFELKIVDEKNTTIEQITNAMLRPLEDSLTEDRLGPYALMVSTFAMARRKALGVDNVLDTILQDLAKE